MEKRDFLVETDLNFWQIIWFKNLDLCHKKVGTLGRWNFGKLELWEGGALESSSFGLTFSWGEKGAVVYLKRMAVKS